MAIQMRRGKYSAFLPSKLQPGEWAVVQSEDDKSADGRSVYMAFAANVVKRMATYDDMVDNCKTAIKESEADIVKSLTDTESEVKDAEAKRVTAENTRVSAESARTTAETARQSNESTRKTNETARKSAETKRVNAETSRATAESARVTAEDARATAESARVSAETSRDSAESTRKTNEDSRVAAEKARVTAESARVSAEKSRVSAETARETASKTAVSNAEAATTAASAAATKATEAAGGCVTAVTTEYAVTTDSTAAPASGWSGTAPTYKQGEFVWSRNVVTHGDGKSETTDPVVITGNDGKSPTATVTKSGTTATITVNNTDGTSTTATVSDGAKGDKGDAGAAFAWNLLYGTEAFPTSGSGTGNKRRYYTDWQERGVTSKTDDGIKLTLTGNVNDCIFVPMADTSGELLEASAKYTLSFTYRGTLSAVGMLFFLPTSGNNYGFGSGASLIGDEQWHDAAITITTPASGSDGLKGCSMLLFYNLASHKGEYIEVKAKSLKLEKGTTATPWCTTQAETIGAKGTDGSSVTAVKLQYAICDSSTTAPTSSWQDSVPDWQTGKYIWQRSATTIKAADGTTTTQYGDAVLWQALDNIGATVGDVEESIHFGDGSLGLLNSAPASGGISLGGLTLTGANDVVASATTKRLANVLAAEAVVLYSNEAGTTSSFTLSESAANFEAMDVFFFHDIGSENVDYSTRLYKPNGRIATLHGMSTVNTTAQYAWSSWAISGKTVTALGECYINFTKAVDGGVSWGTADSTPHLRVRAVVGYRKLA